MSAEASTWAASRAPVPLTPEGDPDPACAVVLAGMASWSTPDGQCGTSVDGIAAATSLYRQQVRNAVIRLEAAGVIVPRPYGWDLNLELTRAEPGETPWQQDKYMSYTARGILADILSRPADFPVSVDTYAGLSLFEGRTRVASAMRELGAAGYLHHVRRRTGAGTTVKVRRPAVPECGDQTCSDCGPRR